MKHRASSGRPQRSSSLDEGSNDSSSDFLPRSLLAHLKQHALFKLSSPAHLFAASSASCLKPTSTPAPLYAMSEFISVISVAIDACSVLFPWGSLLLLLSLHIVIRRAERFSLCFRLFMRERAGCVMLYLQGSCGSGVRAVICQSEGRQSICWSIPGKDTEPQNCAIGVWVDNANNEQMVKLLYECLCQWVNADLSCKSTLSGLQTGKALYVANTVHWPFNVLTLTNILWLKWSWLNLIWLRPFHLDFHLRKCPRLVLERLYIGCDDGGKTGLKGSFLFMYVAALHITSYSQY